MMITSERWEGLGCVRLVNLPRDLDAQLQLHVVRVIKDLDLVLLKSCVEIFTARWISICSITPPSPAAGSLGHVASSDQWAMSTSAVCHLYTEAPPQQTSVWFLPHPCSLHLSLWLGTVLLSSHMEMAAWGWAKNCNTREISIHTGHNPVIDVRRRWVRCELCLAQVHLQNRNKGESKIPQSLKSKMFPVWYYFLNLPANIQNNLLNWIRHKHLNPVSFLLYLPEQKFDGHRGYSLTELISKALETSFLFLTRYQGKAYHNFCLFVFNHEG